MLCRLTCDIGLNLWRSTCVIDLCRWFVLTLQCYVLISDMRFSAQFSVDRKVGGLLSVNFSADRKLSYKLSIPDKNFCQKNDGDFWQCERRAQLCNNPTNHIGSRAGLTRVSYSLVAYYPI